MLLAMQVEMTQAAGVQGRLKGEIVNRCGEFCVSFPPRLLPSLSEKKSGVWTVYGCVALGRLALLLLKHEKEREANREKNGIADIELEVVRNLGTGPKAAAADIEPPILSVSDGDQKDQKGAIEQKQTTDAKDSRDHGDPCDHFDPWQRQGKPRSERIRQHIKAADILQKLQRVLNLQKSGVKEDAAESETK